MFRQSQFFLTVGVETRQCAKPQFTAPAGRHTSGRPAASMIHGYLRCGSDLRGRHDDLNQSGSDVINEA